MGLAENRNGSRTGTEVSRKLTVAELSDHARRRVKPVKRPGGLPRNILLENDLIRGIVAAS